jgi:hypothetical protein
MRLWEFMVAMMLTGACLVMTILILITGQSNEALQREVRAKQAAINEGSAIQQRIEAILLDMGRVAATSEPMRRLLQQHGFQVSAQQPTPQEAKPAPSR